MEAPRRYHHGDVANAMVAEAVQLAREHGPDGIVLREVARRVGVSATAAYRYFDSREALIAAVARRALDVLADAMRLEIASLPARLPRGERALARLRATGRGYVSFAISEPGLFRSAFQCRAIPPISEGLSAPYQLLSDALDQCVRNGVLPVARRPGAEELAWIGVHGLAMLIVDQALPVDGEALEEILERTLDLILDGLGCIDVGR